MSDLDVDRASLPSDDAADPIGLQRRMTPRLPYGTLVLPEEDELASSSKTLSRIEAAQGRYHILRMSHAVLGDDRSGKILAALHGKRLATQANVQTEKQSEDEEDQDATERHWLCRVALLSRLSRIEIKPAYDTFRILELDNNQLTSTCLPAITSYLADNVTLHTLSLSGNEIGGNVAAFVKLAQALGRSTLRRFCLSSNPIMPECLAAFLDSIPADGTALECLELSNVLAGDDETSEADNLAPANAAASVIADARRCRSLEVLYLNGNGFGRRGIRAIVSAVVGGAPGHVPSDTEGEKGAKSTSQGPGASDLYVSISHAKLRRPNRSLESLDLFGNVEPVTQPDDAEEIARRLEEIRKRYVSIPASEIDAIVTFFDLRARRRRLAGASVQDEEDVPFEVLWHLSNLDVTLDEWESDFEEASAIGAGWDAHNWRAMTQRQLKRNRHDTDSCRRCAVQVLAAARVLGCRANRGTHRTEASGFHKFLDLPPELRLSVLRELDEDKILSEHQFGSVISYACDPTTIGYGSDDFDCTRILDSSKHAAVGASRSGSSTLPAPTWSWQECFAKRAPPRNWAADLLDATPEHGRGRQLTDPSLSAFLESTMTHRAEC